MKLPPRFAIVAGRVLLPGLLAAAGLIRCAGADANAPTPLLNVHAHNDYEHKHPLFDALDQGICSVEADIHLVNGNLLIAHDTRQLDPAKTLESLYLDPLRARIRQNGGRLYRNGPECTLLIDFKTPGEPTYAVLREVLLKYADILTVFRDGKKETNAITAVLTGGYPRATLAAEAVRYAAGDGRLPDLASNPPADLIPWLSEDWEALFKWRGEGPMAGADRQKLQSIVNQAHAQHRRVRFYGAPDTPVFWKMLVTNGVDLVNTDDLAGCRKFMEARR